MVLYIKAFVDLQQGCRESLHYICFLPNIETHEWMQTYYREMLADRFMEGKLKVPGHTRLVAPCILATCCDVSLFTLYLPPGSWTGQLRSHPQSISQQLPCLPR